MSREAGGRGPSRRGLEKALCRQTDRLVQGAWCLQGLQGRMRHKDGEEGVGCDRWACRPCSEHWMLILATKEATEEF